MSLDPAKSVIEKFGGPQRVADITGRHVSRVHRWAYPRERGGTGGVIPHDEAEKLLEFARQNGIAVGAEDFFARPPKGEVAA